MLRKRNFIKIGFLLLFSVCIGLSLACVENQNIRTSQGQTYNIKTVYIYEVYEEDIAKQTQEKASPTKFQAIAAESIIEESPNVKGVMRVTDFKKNRDITYPSISPNGDFIIFSLYEPKTKGINIWRKNVEGAGLTRLTKGPFIDIYPIVSKDGKYVYFSSNRSGTFNIWRIRITGGGGITRITTHGNRDFSPDISPDNSQLVFHSYSPGDPTPQIWTCNIDGTSLTQLRVGYRPKWSKDSKKILYLAPQEEKSTSFGSYGSYSMYKVIAGNYDIWEMDIDGTSTTQWSHGMDVVNASYAPNGQIICSAVNENSAKPNKDIWIGKTLLTTNPSDDDFPAFDSQGRLYFRSNRGFSWNFWRTTPIEFD